MSIKAFLKPLPARIENTAVLISLVLMTILPVLEILSRKIGFVGLSGSMEYTRHFTLIVGLFGAVITTREGGHLNLQAGLELIPEKDRPTIAAITTGTTIAVTIGLIWAGIQFVQAEYWNPAKVGQWIPMWIVLLVIPIGYTGVVLRLIFGGNIQFRDRLISAAIALAMLVCFIFLPAAFINSTFWIILILFLVLAALGTPIFAVIGGITLILFTASEVPIGAIPVESYRIVASPILPTIPLFTLAGTILAAGGASKRLVDLFRTWLGWLPAGAAIATACVCTFFTTFTGASGVTILALGGLLLPVLMASGFPKRFSIGLLTASGSLGLLFPPALPVIFYGVISHTPINKLFLAGIFPGIVLLSGVSLFAWFRSRRMHIKVQPFSRREAFGALWEAKWEVLIPILAITGIFSGITTLVETAAIVVIYVIVMELLVHREVRIRKDLIPTFIRSASLVGGILIILSVAMGLTNYMVDAQIPTKAAEWVKANIDSRITFLLVLNLFLLVVGALMDIFSAIMVVVPLILPMGQVFGIHPLHLGIIFLANLELGYLTPPVGINLFLSAFRFERPLMKVYRDTLPFFFLLLAMVLMITYLPWLVLWLPDLMQ